MFRNYIRTLRLYYKSFHKQTYMPDDLYFQLRRAMREQGHAEGTRTGEETDKQT